MLIGSIVRIAYGVGSILAPAKMVSRKLAPDTHELPEPRLLLRAFGGHQIIAGCLTLAALPSRRLARPAALLSLLIDALDVSSAVIEIGARGRSDRSLLGGIILSGAGVITFTAALRVTRRPQESPRSLAVDRPSAAGVQCH
jgi:uncharacterized protein YjeT (DUF2065 family)